MSKIFLPKIIKIC